MSADNPTYDDLVTVALNLNAEGQTSRAHLIGNAADYVKNLEWELFCLRASVKMFLGDCGWHIQKLDDAGQYEIDGKLLKALADALDGAK